MINRLKMKTKPNWVLALLIIIVGSLGLTYLFNVEQNSAFIISSLAALLYLLGGD